jgi:hypothetical protein
LILLGNLCLFAFGHLCAFPFVSVFVSVAFSLNSLCD